MNPTKTGQLISKTRKELGMTQHNLSEKLRVSEQAVSKWERGRSFPDISILVPLSQVLNVSVYDLLEGGTVMDNVAEAKEKPIRKPINEAELEVDGTIEYYAEKMNQYRNMLYMSGYFILISAIAIATQIALSARGITEDVPIPQNIFLGIGLVFAAVALILAIVEKRLNVTFFYAYDTHWQGNALINSSFLFGISICFFYMYSMSTTAIAFLAELILINVITYFVKPSKR